MKILITAALLTFALIVFGVPNSTAEVYTWTDENGNLHISEEPPPKNARVEDVVNYKERTPEEEAARQRRKEEFRRKLEEDKQRLHRDQE